MKITIKTASEKHEQDMDMVITDEDYSTRGYVDIIVGDDVYSVHVTDLYPAIKIFNEIYLEDLKRDELLK